jgi:hypothetical protein
MNFHVYVLSLLIDFDKTLYVDLIYRCVTMKMIVFWGVASCSLVEVYRHFRDTCCLWNKAVCLISLLTVAAIPLYVSELLSDYLAQYPRRQPSSSYSLL